MGTLQEQSHYLTKTPPNSQNNDITVIITSARTTNDSTDYNKIIVINETSKSKLASKHRTHMDRYSHINSLPPE